MTVSAPPAFARAAAIVALLLLVGPQSGARTRTHGDYFLAGYKASRYENWGEALIWFDAAIRLKDRPGGQVKTYGRNFVPYLPYYWRGVALFELGVFDNAARDWTRAQQLWREQFPGRERAFDEYRDDIERRKVTFLESMRADIERYLERIAAETAALAHELAALPRGDPEKTRLTTELDRARLAAERLRGEFESTIAAKSYAGLVTLRRSLDSLLTGVQNDRALLGGVRPAAAPAPAISRGGGPGGAGGGVRRAVDSAPNRRPRPARTPPWQNSPADLHLGTLQHPKDISDAGRTYATKRALLLGFVDYDHWENLGHVTSRLAELEQALRRVGFQVQVVNEQTVADCGVRGRSRKEQVETCLREFVDRYARLGLGGRTLLLVHIVGHGHTVCVDGASLGLVLLPGAPRPPDGLPRRCDSSVPRETWSYVEEMANEALVADFFRQFQGRAPHHLLITLESCFSGQFVEGLGAPNLLQWNVARTNPAFLFLTAGAANQLTSATLPLTSAYATALDGCRGAGRYILGYDLANYLIAKVRTADVPSLPQFGKFKVDPWDQGDIVLVCP